MFSPIVTSELPVIVGEYGLNTGFPAEERAFFGYMQNQLSLWAGTPGMLGSFFWNHRVSPSRDGWYKEFSLLDLLRPTGPLPQVVQMGITALCPGSDLSKCPIFNPDTVTWDDECLWLEG